MFFIDSCFSPNASISNKSSNPNNKLYLLNGYTNLFQQQQNYFRIFEKLFYNLNMIQNNI